jgi:hypothetical protein
MYFLFLKLVNTDYKEDVILAMQSVGIARATAIDGHDLDTSLADEFSFFSGFFKSEEERMREQIVITALCEDKNQVRRMLDMLREADIDIDKEAILRVILMPVASVFDKDMGWQNFDEV